MDFEKARYNMVEQQIRPWDVLDNAVLDLLFEVKREEYVPDAYRKLALADLEVPIGYGESMLAPKLEAKILQQLALRKSDRVLEIGSGTGYMTALLAAGGQHVYSVEILPELSAMAEKNLKKHHISNVTLEIGDGSHGWGKHGPYDAIVLTGSTPILAEEFQKELHLGGRLVAIVGEDPVMKAKLITRIGKDAWHAEDLFETRIAPLKNAPKPQKFAF
ncbi:MAG TPA: protein-L-isoaspartate O-methyltransferase [Burkholderiales bacterium]|nr:protein-L-isoaspartate O-methyltransferase [Burkholderiales bacterium]